MDDTAYEALHESRLYISPLETIVTTTVYMKEYADATPDKTDANKHCCSPSSFLKAQVYLLATHLNFTITQ